MALVVEGVVDGCVGRKKRLCCKLWLRGGELSV